MCYINRVIKKQINFVKHTIYSVFIPTIIYTITKLEKFDKKQFQCRKKDLILINHHPQSLNNRHVQKLINLKENYLFYRDNHKNIVIFQSILHGHRVKRLVSQWQLH